MQSSLMYYQSILSNVYSSADVAITGVQKGLLVAHFVFALSSCLYSVVEVSA